MITFLNILNIPYDPGRMGYQGRFLYAFWSTDRHCYMPKDMDRSVVTCQMAYAKRGEEVRIDQKI
jgi:hypothetical protein